MQGLYMNEAFQPRCYTKLLRTHPHDDEERSLEPEQIVCGVQKQANLLLS